MTPPQEILRSRIRERLKSPDLNVSDRLVLNYWADYLSPKFKCSLDPDSPCMTGPEKPGLALGMKRDGKDTWTTLP
jgi:hypothetical protein